MEFKHILEKLTTGKHLHSSEAKFIMYEALEGGLSEVETAAWLAASATKGETAIEISAYAQVMREKSKKVFLDSDVMDTCGTGGDNSNLMNVSTLTAMVLASLQIPVAKHGNRSVSSKCGSADILESLGYEIKKDSPDIKSEIENSYFTFLYAPHFHSAMKHVGAARKELGVRTVFNILGPLCNPAGASIHLMGVFSVDVLQTISNALVALETKCALVFSSEDHLDEISPVGKTKYHLIYNGKIIEGALSPSPNITMKSLEPLRVTSKEKALEIAKETLLGKFNPGVEIVALNAAAGVFLWELNKKTTKPESIQTYINNKFPALKKQIQEQSLLKVTKSWATT